MAAAGSLTIVFADAPEGAADRTAELAGLVGPWGGEEVKRSGHGFMAVFDCPSRALGCASALAAAGGRCGVNAGEPSYDRGDYFGVSVNVARRLCDHASAGQAVASRLVLSLCLDPPAAEPMGALELRGVTEPVEAVRPARMSEAPRHPLRTVLVTDLVGSTRMLSELGDDRAEEIRRTHFARLRSAAWARGGRELGSTGDGVLFAFVTARDALACGQAMQRAIGREGEVQIRVGLDAGEFDADQGRTGPVPGAAQMLCDAAEVGEIRVSDRLRGLVGTRGGFTFAPVEGAARWSVDWQDSAGARVRLPAALGAAPERPFTGRDRELGRALAAWREVREGEIRKLLVVSGPPGSGRSRLAREVAVAAHDEGATVMAGAARGGEGLVDFEPIVEALREYVEACPLDDLAPQLAAAGGALTLYAPELADRLPVAAAPTTGDPAAHQARFVGAVEALIAGAAGLAPVVLVLEDLERADDATLGLVRRLVSDPTPVPLLVVTTVRGQAEEDGAALRALAEIAGAEHVALGGPPPGRRHVRRRTRLLAGAAALLLVLAGLGVVLLAGGGGDAKKSAAERALEGLPPPPRGWPTPVARGTYDDAPPVPGQRLLGTTLANGFGLGGWQGYDDDRNYAQRFARNAAAEGLVPLVTYYQLREAGVGSSDDESQVTLAALRNPRAMRAYYADLSEALRQLSSVRDQPVTLAVEPELWGLAQVAAGDDRAESVPASVASSGVPALRGLPDSLAGFAQGVVRLRDQLAPRVRLGYGLRDYGDETEVARADLRPTQLDALARRSVSFYRSLGARFQLAFTPPGLGARDAADLRRHARWLGAVSRATKLPVVLEDVPRTGAQRALLTPAGRPLLQAYRAAGVIGALFAD